MTPSPLEVLRVQRLPDVRAPAAPREAHGPGAGKGIQERSDALRACPFAGSSTYESCSLRETGYLFAALTYEKYNVIFFSSNFLQLFQVADQVRGSRFGIIIEKSIGPLGGRLGIKGASRRFNGWAAPG